MEDGKKHSKLTHWNVESMLFLEKKKAKPKRVNIKAPGP